MRTWGCLCTDQHKHLLKALHHHNQGGRVKAEPASRWRFKGLWHGAPHSSSRRQPVAAAPNSGGSDLSKPCMLAGRLAVGQAGGLRDEGDRNLVSVGRTIAQS